MIAYLIEFVVSYMNQPTASLPSGLGAILDFNNDGVINMDEVSWLKDNRLTTMLTDKYNAVLAWDRAN
jgi:hypothetical protein